MELRRLRYFIAVAEELHFGRAAERLDMAQPPLSRQIAQLEQTLDVKLFDRSRAQVRLTPAGETLYERACAIVDQLDSAFREVARISKGGAGRLRGAFVGSASHGVLPTIVKAYRARFPDVDLALSAMNNAELERALVRGEIDVAVARPALPGEAFRTLEILREPLVLAAPDDRFPSADAPIALADLTSETFVLYPRRPRPSFADHVLATLEKNAVTPEEIVYARDFQTAISLVSVGVGISIVPESVSNVRRPGVAFHSFLGHNPCTGLSAHARRDNPKPHVLRFFELLAERARR